MKRRYSHLGPVAMPKGRPLTHDTIVTLWDANKMLDWSTIARTIGIGRSTLYRAVEGGNAHEMNAQAIERFAVIWAQSDDMRRAAMMRRWSEKRRAAYERKRRAA